MLADGKRSTHRHDAVLVSIRKLIGWTLAHSARIPPQYIVASAEHEAGCAYNEVDTESDGYESWGLFQVGDRDPGFAKAMLPLQLDPECAVRSFVKLQEGRLDDLLKEAKLSAPTPDCWFYLALWHNQGPGAGRKTIQRYGLDAKAYVARNPEARINKYGLDCMTGGDMWPAGWKISA